MANLKLLHKGKTWNARKTPEGATEFHVGWVNYLDENDEWKEIDTNFREENGEFIMDKAGITVKAPLLSDGTAEFIVTEKFHVTSKKKINETEMPLTIKALGVAQVSGVIETGDLGWGECNYIVYPQAYPTLDADLIYFVHHGRVERLRKLIRFNSAITQDENISFEIGYNETDIDVKNWDENLPDKIKYKKWNKSKIKTNRGLSYRKGTSNRGSTTKSLRIWDSTRDTLPVGRFNGNLWQRIDSEVEYISTGLLKLTKIIPADFFTLEKVYPIYADTTTTKYPDQDAESTTVDGRVYVDDNTNDSWADVHDGVVPAKQGAGPSDATVYCHHNDAAGNGIYLGRTIFLFDTSSIDDGDNIDSATMSLYGDGLSWTQSDGEGTAVVESNPASNTNLVGSDFNTYPNTHEDTILSGLIDNDDWADAAYNDFTINATGLALVLTTGITKFGVRNSLDYNENTSHTNWTPPSAANNWGHACKGADTAGTSTDPKLVIEHSAGGGGGGSLASNLGLLGAG